MHKRGEKKRKPYEKVCMREKMKLQGLGGSRSTVQAQHEDALVALTVRWPWSLSLGTLEGNESENESKNRERQRIAGARY